MATRTKVGVKAAFKQFVRLVEAIPEVKHVVGFDDGGPEFFTYIDGRDDAACLRIFTAEKSIRKLFPEDEIDFHIVYLQGRALQQVVAPLPELVFSRSA